MTKTTLTLPKIETLNTENDFIKAYNFIAAHLFLCGPNYYDFLNSYWFDLKFRAIEHDCIDVVNSDTATHAEHLLYALADEALYFQSLVC